MRTIERTGTFKRDLKRVVKSTAHRDIEGPLEDLFEILRADAPLDEKFRDHALVGPWTGCRDCHVKPDVVLIYRKPDDKVLQLLRIGTHSELGF